LFLSNCLPHRLAHVSNLSAIRPVNSIVLGGNAMSTLFCQLPGESRVAVPFPEYAAPERAGEGDGRHV